MQNTQAVAKTLKEILESIRAPEDLDAHPWTKSLIVREAAHQASGFVGLSPGQQLVLALGKLFASMRPSRPPRRGLRLDTRWGEFGLLAAQYFAPLSFGLPYPDTLRESWDRIDEALLRYAYEGASGELSAEQIARYKLVGDELGAASTISDWHRKGIERLAETILAREQFLAATSSQASSILGANGSRPASGDSRAAQHRHETKTGRTARVRWVLAVSLAALLVSLLILGGIKARRVYQTGMSVLGDASRLQGLVSASSGLEEIDAAGPLLDSLQSDIASLRQEVEPFLWLTPKLDWVPVYGCDLAASPDLLDLADSLSASANESYQAGRPLLEVLRAGDTLNPEKMASLFVQMEPQVSAANGRLLQAQNARAKIDASCLSPYVHDLLVGKVDPILAIMQDGQSAALALPSILGATPEGPKTYLLLVQNEDEFRPTGGFITAAGNLVIRNGKVISLEFESSEYDDNWSKPYPEAPWQLQAYMDSPVLIFRDANWYTDYPTAAQWAEYLYAYTHDHSVDGVIAFDQHMLVMLLEVLGPLEVEGAPYPITATNVVAYMRQAKQPPVNEPVPPDWYNKEFISQIANAVLDRLLSGDGLDWKALSGVMLRALDEKHLLLRFDDPVMTDLLARRAWDGAVGTASGDFLMVVDTNVGFNKTNAVVESSLSYDVDLTDPSAPESSLSVFHTNHASETVPCLQWNDAQEIPGERSYPIDRCYWNYLRVYTPQGTTLLDATPHAVPAGWMMLGDGVPARVDVLDEEINGLQGFGSLLVVPGGKTLSTAFHFALPAAVVSRGADFGLISYRLKVQKQPGSLAVPLVLRIHLPAHAIIEVLPAGASLQNKNLILKTDLRRDLQVELVFRLP